MFEKKSVASREIQVWYYTPTPLPPQKDHCSTAATKFLCPQGGRCGLRGLTVFSFLGFARLVASLWHRGKRQLKNGYFSGILAKFYKVNQSINQSINQSSLLAHKWDSLRYYFKSYKLNFNLNFAFVQECHLFFSFNNFEFLKLGELKK